MRVALVLLMLPGRCRSARREGMNHALRIVLEVAIRRCRCFRQISRPRCVLAAHTMIPTEPDRRQDPVIEMDIECDQQGVEICIHTLGLTPFAYD